MDMYAKMKELNEKLPEIEARLSALEETAHYLTLTTADMVREKVEKAQAKVAVVPNRKKEAE